MDTHPTAAVERWLRASERLLDSLKPARDRASVLMKARGTEIPMIALEQVARVDHALVAMATAASESELGGICEQLEDDTLMALFFRWRWHADEWEKLLDDQAQAATRRMHVRDAWRSVLLSLVDDQSLARTETERLWPEGIQGFHQR